MCGRNSSVDGLGSIEIAATGRAKDHRPQTLDLGTRSSATRGSGYPGPQPTQTVGSAKPLRERDRLATVVISRGHADCRFAGGFSNGTYVIEMVKLFFYGRHWGASERDP